MFSDPFLASYDKSDISAIADSEMLERMQNADLFVTNEEFPFSLRGEAMEDKQFTFRADPKYVEIFQKMGVDIATVANNHALDFGRDAFLDTLDTLKSAGITCIGGGYHLSEASAPAVQTIKGQTFAIFGATRVSPSATWYASDSQAGLFQTYDATLLNQNIAFYDLAFNKIYPSKNASLRDGFKESFLSYPHLRVSLEDKDYGFIVIIDDSRQELSDYEAMILTHASTALKLIAQKYISNMEIETRYRDGFVQDIVLNNIKSLQEVVKRGKIYGWDLSEKFYTAVIVDIDDFKIQYLNIRSKEDSETIEKHNDDIFDYSLKFFRRFFKTVLYTKFTDSTAFIIKHDKPDEATAQKILSCCNTLKGELQAAYNFTVTIGISEPKGSIMDCHIAYQEAQKAVKISRLVYKRDNTATYSALGIYKFLDGIKDNPSVQEFYKGYIEKICRHDELHNTDFMETLVNIVQNGWNLKLASDTMFLHYNTIKYRYKKIEEISGLNLDRTEEKLSMELAVKIYLMTHI